MNYPCVLVILLSIPVTVMGLPTGAPDGACTHMTPAHGRTPQTSDTYILEISSHTYKAGTPITVKITGQAYQGILLQVREVGSDVPVGTFSSPPTDTQLKRCSNANDAVTHKNTNSKGDGHVYTWTPPDGLDGDIEFVATIAANHDTYWVKEKSIPLTAELFIGVIFGTSDEVTEPGDDVTEPSEVTQASDETTQSESDSKENSIACNVQHGASLLGLLLAVTMVMKILVS